MKKLFAIVLICATLALGGCDALQQVMAEPGPEDTVENLEKALTAMDYDGIIACMDPSSQALISGITSFMGIVTSAAGYSFDVASAFPGLMEFASLAGNGTTWPTFDLEVVNINYTNEDETQASVTVSIGGSTLDGQVLAPETEVWTMKKVDDTWYIAVDW